MNLEPIGINYHYINGEPKNYYIKNGKALPSSYAILWCMLAMGINRIFSRESMREFLFRLAITFHSTNLVETWFLKDHLMNYSVGDGKYTLKLEEIAMHFGIEVVDHYNDVNDRKDFFARLSRGIYNAAYIGKMENFTVLAAERDASGEISLTKNNPAPAEITDEMIANAEFFADDLMRFIPEQIFSNRSEEIPGKEKQLHERREKIKNLPVFDLEKVPFDIIKKCAETIFIDEYAQKILNSQELIKKDLGPLIYLAWLLHNDFLERDDYYFLEPIEGIPFRYEDYMAEDKSYKLEETIEQFELESLEPFLKGLFINQ
ncbi:hypothetical protein [Marinilabilia salmonicolor]|uniref:Uncharacterized protein n=1 Tax=Marinilabilia salmonicolor TaxID=989 RepID=A0A368V6H5_9BACT|nr:hypothetical protein [Marinilabilia salmonicolor]RCW36757.1 hypothetical protein DFO77_10748 [Marinilabilia salmonicolor]